ncbi:putative amino-terminal amidase [Rosellinia necatrix]|uniref:Putative amino-terminal amidase n=1 Tax=Rosellinia necatrix TaxID=77044 RepID=A0A1W2TX01_ROSNE|nr:putative amino-terminal amidase [Rosellinia necatrix]
MRIGCLQFAPQVGDVENNVSRADGILREAEPGNLDLLILPELAFTGYNFKSLQDITPFLEPQNSGLSALWARRVALENDCVVTVGYPEKVEKEPESSVDPEYYNSVIALDDHGEMIAHYRKTFLYYTDETWALEGQEGFYDGFIPGLGTTSMGICMDLNPYKFAAPWSAFEFASHCLRVEAKLVIVTLAWNTREDASSFSLLPNEPDMHTLAYWVARLEPLTRSEPQEEVIIAFCNRCGVEDDAVYAGTSAVIGVKGSDINVYGILGRGEEALLIVDTEKPPFAKLVYRSDNQNSTVPSDPESASDSGAAGQMNSDKTTTTGPLPPEGNPDGRVKVGASQNQALCRGACSTSQPHSVANCTIQSSYALLSSKKPYSTHVLRSGEAAPTGPSATRNHHHHLGVSQSGSDRCVIPLHSRVSSKGSFGSALRRGPDRLGPSKVTKQHAIARADSPTLSMSSLTSLQV